MKQHIPNMVTSLNLLCGVLGILSLSYGSYTSIYVIAGIPTNDLAIYLMFAAAFFDFCDGFVARALKVDSPLGKQLDSLADVVTFGVLPGLLMFILTNSLLGITTDTQALDLRSTGSHITNFNGLALLYCLPALLVPILSAFRLAKFNIDTRQSHSFIGLPTPANGLFLATVYYVVQHNSFNAFTNLHPALISGLVLIFALLLVSPVPLFAMKFKSFGWKGNEVRFIFLALAIGLLAIFQLAAVPIIVILYILISVINNIVTRNKNEVQGPY